MKLVKQIEDEELRFKLEKEVLRLMAETKTTTLAEVSLEGNEISPEQDVEVKQDITADLLTLFNTK